MFPRQHWWCFTRTVVVFQSQHGVTMAVLSLGQWQCLLWCFRVYALPSSSVSLGLLCCFRVCTVFHHCLFHWDCCAVSESVCFTIIVCFTGTVVQFQRLYSFPSLSVSLVVLCCFRVCTIFHHCLFHWECCAVSESVWVPSHPAAVVPPGQACE